MPRETVVASKGKIRIDNSDGTYTELVFMMPHDIAEKILCNIITWEEDWITNTKTHLEYQEVSKEFSERLKAEKETPSVMENKSENIEQNPPFCKTDVSSRLNVYEYIWSKVFPNEELNYDDFYDWSRENANRALELALEYCDLNGC